MGEGEVMGYQAASDGKRPSNKIRNVEPCLYLCRAIPANTP